MSNDRPVVERLRELATGIRLGQPKELVNEAADTIEELVKALKHARQALAMYQPDSAPTFYMEAIWAADEALAKIDPKDER